jgi:hypothetical protein
VKVQADVADLKTGVQQTNDTLGSLDGKVSQLGTTFSGFENILERVTERFAAYELIRKSIDFAETAVEDAAALQHLSDATGISTDALQKLQYVGASFGVESDQMTRAVSEFEAKLAGGDHNAVGAVQSLGLSVQQLLSMSPDQAFLAFTAAASTVADPMQKNALYADAFGVRLGRIIAQIGDAHGAFNSVSKDAIISPEVIKSADDFVVRLEHIKQEAEAVMDTALFHPGGLSRAAAEALGIPASALDALTAAQDQNAASEAHKHAADIQLVSDQQLVDNWLQQLTKSHESLTAKQEEEIQTAHDLGASTSDIAKHLGVTQEAVTSYIKTLDDQKKAQDELDKAINDLDSAGDTYLDTLQSMDAAQVASIKNYLSAGVSQHDLAIAYGLTAAQIKAVSDSLRDEQALTKQQNQIDTAAINELTSLWVQYDQIRSTQGHTTVEQQIADANAWRDAQIQAAQKAGTATTQMLDAIDAVYMEKTQSILVDWQSINNVLDTQTQAGLQAVADKAKATYEALAADATKFAGTSKAISDTILQQFRDQADKAQLAADSFGHYDATAANTAAVTDKVTSSVTASGDAFNVLKTNIQQIIPTFKTAADSADAMYDAYEKAGMFVNISGVGMGASLNNVTPGGRLFAGGIPGFAKGGVVTSPTLAMVGEDEPEAIIPFSKMTGGGGDTYNISINVVASNPATAGASVIAEMKKQGIRLPSARG